jgi:hypothetical protein
MRTQFNLAINTHQTLTRHANTRQVAKKLAEAIPRTELRADKNPGKTPTRSASEDDPELDVWFAVTHFLAGASGWYPGELCNFKTNDSGLRIPPPFQPLNQKSDSACVQALRCSYSGDSFKSRTSPNSSLIRFITRNFACRTRFVPFARLAELTESIHPRSLAISPAL